MTTTASGQQRRQAFRDYALDGALLRFHPATGTQVRVQNAATRHLQRVVPRVVMFGITNKCTMSCSFCSRDVQRDSAWTVESAAQVLRELAEAGVLEVAFGGGEPFAFRGFAELVDELHRSTALALNVTTNGALIRPGSFARFAGRLGQVRISIYDDPCWRVAGKELAAHGQLWGANVLVDAPMLQRLPALLAELAALGCHDVSLLSYIGAEACRHLGPEERERLAAIVQDAVLPCRLSVCFGATVPLARLFDGADDSGDCGAGVDFVSITPDQRMQGCSFHDGGLPAGTAEEILQGWRLRRARLAQPSLRQGCAGRRRQTAAKAVRAETAPSIRIWQAFSGNNSGECVMVARFTSEVDAQAYLAQLLPGWEPDAEFSAPWQQLLKAEAVALPDTRYSEMPREMLAIGHSVLAIGYGAEDVFPELRALAWKQGAAVLPGGIHSHEVALLAAVQTGSSGDAAGLVASGIAPGFRAYAYGASVLLVGEMSGEEGDLPALKQQLEQAAAGRPLAAEIVDSNVPAADLLEVMKRLGKDIAMQPRMALYFWSRDSEAKAAAFARMVTEAETVVAGRCVLISGLARRKRLALLAYRQGAVVHALDSRELVLRAQLHPPATVRTLGKATQAANIDMQALRQELQAFAHGALNISESYSGTAVVQVSTSEPEKALAQLVQVADRLGLLAYFWLTEADPLALAVRRLLAEVRQ